MANPLEHICKVPGSVLDAGHFEMNQTDTRMGNTDTG